MRGLEKATKGEVLKSVERGDITPVEATKANERMKKREKVKREYCSSRKINNWGDASDADEAAVVESLIGKY